VSSVEVAESHVPSWRASRTCLLGFEIRFLLRCSLAKVVFGCRSRGGGFGVGGGDVEVVSEMETIVRDGVDGYCGGG
jgi:hypothetical protein